MNMTGVDGGCLGHEGQQHKASKGLMGCESKKE